MLTQLSMSLSDNNHERTIYCIDTSALLHGWRRDYPPDVFSNVWNRLSEFADNGFLIAPEEVLLELKRGGDDIYQWARSHRNMFLPPDPNVQREVTKIVNRWPNFVPDCSHDGVWADPYVIAIAVTRQATVVTGEKLAGTNARSPKIPNICEALHVPWLDLLGLLRCQGWRF
jgi:hypothetical protein